jgi:hypothetical protein
LVVFFETAMVMLLSAALACPAHKPTAKTTPIVRRIEISRN